MTKKQITGAIVGIAALIVFLIWNPLVLIDAGERGVVLRWGAVTDRILEEGGPYWIWPVRNSIKKFRVTAQKVAVEASASSKDLQIVTSKIAVNYNLNPAVVNRIYQVFRYDVDKILITPAIHEALKASAAKYTAEELITKRELVKHEFQTNLAEGLQDNGVLVTDVFITDFDFSQQFNDAIEAKVQAEQEALREKNNLMKVKYEAEQRVTHAKAEAEAIRIQAQAIKAQGGKDYVNLKWIEAWAKGGAQVPQIVNGDKGGNFLFDLRRK